MHDSKYINTNFATNFHFMMNPQNKGMLFIKRKFGGIKS